MAIFKVEYHELDNYGNKIITVNENGQSKEYIISPKDKKTGKPFPDFENIKSGSEVMGNPWTSKTNGKHYIFPIDENKAGAFKKPIEKAMERKEASIGHFQDQKEMSIKVASTFSAATNITIALIEKGGYEGKWEDKWLEVRDWLWSKYDTDDKSQTPF